MEGKILPPSPPPSPPHPFTPPKPLDEVGAEYEEYKANMMINTKTTHQVSSVTSSSSFLLPRSMSLSLSYSNLSSSYMYLTPPPPPTSLLLSIIYYPDPLEYPSSPVALNSSYYYSLFIFPILIFSEVTFIGVFKVPKVPKVPKSP